jgi:hypothetical protein
LGDDGSKKEKFKSTIDTIFTLNPKGSANYKATFKHRTVDGQPSVTKPADKVGDGFSGLEGSFKILATESEVVLENYTSTPGGTVTESNGDIYNELIVTFDVVWQRTVSATLEKGAKDVKVETKVDPFGRPLEFSRDKWRVSFRARCKNASTKPAK